MALEGTLKDFSLADIFQLISIQRKTGVLTLKARDDVVTVSFKDGNVVSSDSVRKNLEDRIGQVLVKSGRLTEAKLKEALATQKETLQRLGHVMVQGGLISEDDLRDALRIQVAQMVYRLFLWKDGDYHFSQEEDIEFDPDHFTPMSAESVLLEGVRMIDEWPLIERRIPSFNLAFRKTRPDVVPVVLHEEDPGNDDIEAELDRALSGEPFDRISEKGGLKLTTVEALIYDQVDGKTTVQEIIDRGYMSDFETCRLLYDLACRNLITTSEAPEGKGDDLPRRRPSLTPIMEMIAYAVLVLVVLASVLSLSHSPLAGSLRVLAPADTITGMLDMVTRNRIQRLDEAVQVYYLQKGFYPDDLGDLLRGRLVVESTLLDPWGRRFGYLSSDLGYRIIAYNQGGVENTEQSIERGHMTHTAAGPKESEARTAPAGRR